MLPPPVALTPPQPAAIRPGKGGRGDTEDGDAPGKTAGPLGPLRLHPGHGWKEEGESCDLAKEASF